MKRAVRVLAVTAAASLLALALVVFLFDLPGVITSDLQNGKHWSHEIDESYEFDGAMVDELTIDLSFEDVEILPAEGDHLTLRYAGVINATAELPEPFLEVDHTETRLSVKNPRAFFDIGRFSGKMRLEVAVPAASLERLSLDLSSGDAVLEGFSGEELRMESSSGDCTVRDSSLRGALHLEATSGDTVLSGVSAGTMELRSSSGHITGDRVEAAEIQLDSTSGDVEFRGLSGDIRQNSSSGDVTLEFDRPGSVRADTTSGRIRLILPEDAEFSLVTSTSSGDIRCDFPLTVSGSLSDSDIRGQVGGGTVELNLSTSSGDIRVEKK